MSVKQTLSSEEQKQDYLDNKEADKNIQNIPNRRSLKGSSKKMKKKKVVKSASAFRTISEVANELGVQQHVLRFWETKFSHIKPLKRGGGRRYYRPEDVALLKNIHHLLYSDGYTIKGVQKLLQTTRGNLSQRVNQSTEVLVKKEAVKEVSPVAKVVSDNREELETMLGELKSMRKLISE